ncbi:MAG TPA: hypothetical protein VGL09_01770 [Methylomirabilota bacterium]
MRRFESGRRLHPFIVSVLRRAIDARVSDDVIAGARELQKGRDAARSLRGVVPSMSGEMQSLSPADHTLV